MLKNKQTIRAFLLTGTILTMSQAPVLAQEETNALEPLVVEGASYETEDTNSYSSNLVSVGEKDVLTVREIPQSTHVVTRDRLDDGSFTSLDTVMRKMPGIVVLPNEDGRSSIFSRGFEYDNLYFNGLPAPLSSIYGTQPDMAIVDHVEILRGPQGLYGGTGEPAGTVNMRLKQAKKEFGGSASISGGSWGTYRGDADITGPLTEDGSIRGRIVGAKSDSDGWVDGAEYKADVAYGTVAADLNEQTTLTFSLSHLARDSKPYNGLPALLDGTLLDASVHTRIGADWDRFENDVKDYILELEHKFTDGGHVKGSMRYADRAADFKYIRPFIFANSSGDFSRIGMLARDFEEESLALDLHVSKPFEVMEMDANIILGVDYRGYESDMKQATDTDNTTTYNIHSWNSSSILESAFDASWDTDQTTESSQYGVYSNFRISPIEPLTLIFGSRLSWYESEVKNNLTGAISDKVDIETEFTPYLGTTFDLNDNFTAYASYTSIFQPQDETDASGHVIDPRTGNQYEIGVKGSSLSGDINGSVSLFRINDKNRAVSDLNNPGSSLAAGEVTVEGLEAEIGGRLVKGLDVSAGYTFTMSEDKETGVTFSTWTPKHIFQLAAQYDMGTAAPELAGWDVGGALKAYDDIYTISGGDTFRAGGYAVLDAFTSYEITDGLTAHLNVDNVLNRKYYERTGSSFLFNFYGKPRTYTMKLTADF